MGLLLDFPNKVFREMKTMVGWYIVPSSPALFLIRLSQRILKVMRVFVHCETSCVKPLERH